MLGALCMPGDSSAAGVGAFDELGRQVDNWPRLVDLLKDHRVVPLAAKNVAFMQMKKLPAEVKAELTAWAGANAREAFRYLAVLQQLLTLFAKEDITAVVLKGVPLSLMAHGDVSARDVGDIDLLIQDRDALRADGVLRQAGLIRKEPAAKLTHRRASFYLRHFKDFTYEATANGFEVDLHWRLMRDSKIAAAILPGPFSADSQAISLGTLNVRVLPIKQTLLFLAAHGAMEGWARWKTLADIVALWSKVSPQDQADTWKFAQESSTTGFLAAALALAEEWFGMTCSEDVRVHLLASTPRERRIFEHIVGQARRLMLQNAYMVSPAGSSTFAMKLREMTLHPSAKSRLELARRVLFRPRIWETIDLPDSLFLLYPLLSPVEWLSFRRQQAAERRPHL